MGRKVLDWIEDRTGLETALKHFLNEDIPASSGWHQVFGAIALFAFLVQVVTGILLAFNYAPTPGDAYSSLKYIVTELTAGRMIRGLHHWGASMMIIIVGLHLIQVFLYGAYKKPREATWMVGVVLLLITLAFGLTGYLLPWDNRAYWGTVVTTQIASHAPVIGPYLTRLMGGAAGIGVVTFARFYALHVLLLPPVTMLLIGLHVYLVRRHGVTPSAGDVAPKKKFFPQQVFRDTLAVFVYFAIMVGMAVAVRVPLGHLADPTDIHFIPRPEWYFLFLFQTLKFFEGPLEIVGTVVLPTLAILVLFLLPFIDRGRAMKVTKRTVALSVLALAVIGWSGLTAAAILSTPKTAESEEADSEVPQGWKELPADELAGIGFYRAANCASCHAEKKSGPDLTQAPVGKPADWMIDHFKQRAAPLNDSQSKVLATLLTKLNPQNIEALQTAPDFAVEGAVVYQMNHCNACHQVNGIGKQLGPPLNDLATRRSREWVVEHFADPQKMSAGTIMPPYKFNPKDLDRITAFSLALPKLP